MEPFLSNFAHFSLRLLLLRKLQGVTQVWLTQQYSGKLRDNDGSSTLFQPEPADFSIPLKKAENIAEVVYVSAIAQKLSAQANRSVSEIVHQLTTLLLPKLNPSCQDSFSSSIVWRYFTIQPSTLGWIYFKLSEIGVAEWLQHLWVWSRIHQFREQAAATATFNLSSTQYIHARCCSLLRLAEQQSWVEGAVTRHHKTNGLQDENLPSGGQISWLQTNGQLRLHHRAEQELIAQLMNLIDQWTDDPGGLAPHLWSKRAHKLALAFDAFDRQCQIGGTVIRDLPDLAQARLGLVQITQRLLQALLQERLGQRVLWEL